MRASAAAIGLAIAFGVLGGLAQGASGSPSTMNKGRYTPGAPAAAFASAGLLDNEFCTLVGKKEVQAAGVALLGYFLKKKISTTSIYTTGALTSISLLCKPVMKRAVPALARFLRIAPRPTRAPTRSEYASHFGRATASSVSQKLQRIGWNYTPATVNTITSELCYVIRQGLSPLSTLRKWFVKGKLDSLAALNGLVAYAATCRPALTAAQLGYLTSSITSYLTDNTFARDYTPPVTLLFTPRESLLANGLVRVTITWSSFDFGGQVVEQTLLIGTNSRWYALSNGVHGSQELARRPRS